MALLLPMLGSIGIGLVWGWLVGLRNGAARASIGGALVLVGATLAVVLEVWLFAGGLAVAAFAGGAMGAWSIHTVWQWSLRQHFGFRPI